MKQKLYQSRYFPYTVLKKSRVGPSTREPKQDSEKEDSESHESQVVQVRVRNTTSIYAIVRVSHHIMKYFTQV